MLVAHGVIDAVGDASAGIPAAVMSIVRDDTREDGEARVCAAAEALAAATGATFALVLLGSRGEDEGVYGASGGQTWIGCAGPSGSAGQMLAFGGRDDYTLVRIGNQALGMLWRILK
jgi:nicotinamide mononucleotide (NMN) deamidase PncC